jgi:hypothetical protein
MSYRNFNGMCWPAPSEKLTDLAWRLCNTPKTDGGKRLMSVEDCLLAASVIDAYGDLIYKPIARRNAIIRELSKGPSA